ncbi:P-II family nitrogen regulator [Calothrix sp. 336/3]|uniref:P-II family nitrogen regulator n=1 Tax=Calothrix sp. 336/3 TaxID=1337936 RepID=UPI0004E38415|nr:nitrogen regulatory protein P-II [Calothrix sp. 336/3]AKG20645.1 nitrogen regulatory protein P-II [Calothrix sp. 336/3]
MNIVKRLEIIANYVELEKILQALEKAEVPGYTVIRDVAGKSSRGDGSHNMAMTMLDNVYIIAFFSPDKVTAVTNNIQPILNKFGGSCFISDAMELNTTKCSS